MFFNDIYIYIYYRFKYGTTVFLPRHPSASRHCRPCWRALWTGRFHCDSRRWGVHVTNKWCFNGIYYNVCLFIYIYMINIGTSSINAILMGISLDITWDIYGVEHGIQMGYQWDINGNINGMCWDGNSRWTLIGRSWNGIWLDSFTKCDGM